MIGTDCSRICQANCCVRKVFDTELVITRPTHNVFVVSPETGKVHILCAFNVGHE